MLGRNCFVAGLAWVTLVAGGAEAAPLVTVSLAYYDNEHASPTIPNPWQGSPNTTFFGSDASNGIFDTGAILVTNFGPGNTVIGPALIVDGFANGASFRLWDSQVGGGLTVQPGSRVIFAQPTDGAFDTSDQPIIADPTQRTNNHPVVHITIDGARYNFTDTTQVLNTGGFDPGNAYGISESRPWTQVASIPEPAALMPMLAAIVPLLKRRRRIGSSLAVRHFNSDTPPQSRCRWASCPPA